MDNLLDTLIRNKKLTVEQAVELLSGYSQDQKAFEMLFQRIDVGIHLAHAVKSRMCFPYLATMLLDDKAVVFRLDEGDLSNYPNDDFGTDVEQCSHLKYLTEDPCLYFDQSPKIVIQDSMLEELSYRERIMNFSPLNSYALGCIVNVSQYGLQTEDLSLPAPSDCEGNDILMKSLQALEKEAHFQLEARHHKKLKSFFKVPGLQIYYPHHDFGDTEERGMNELRQFQKYFAEKVEPKLCEILSI